MAWEEYFVDSVNGSDSNDGQSEDTPWQTAAKVTAMAAATPFLFRTAINLKRGSTFTTPMELVQQGTPFTWLRIRAYGDESLPRPKFELASATTFRAGIWLDSCFAVHVDETDVDGGGIDYVSCIGAASFAKPERAFPVHVTNAELTNAGYDLINISASASSLNTAFGYAAGSNQQGRGYLIRDVVGDKARNDGFSFNGITMDVRIENYTLSNIGTGTATPIDANSGDALTFHDGAGFIYVGRGTVDGAVEGLHAINWGAGTGTVDGLKVRNVTGSLIRCEMWAETLSGVQQRVDWNVFNFIGHWPSTATGAAAIVFGREDSTGSLVSGRLWNSTIVSEKNAPTILVEWLADARADECFLDVRSCAIQSTGKHVQLTRNGRTPFIKFAGNRYNAEGRKWTVDGTDYDLPSWRALTDGTRVLPDEDLSYPTTVGVLGLTGDLTDDFENAAPASGSWLPRRGENLGPTYYPFSGVDRRDALGRRRSLTRAWDVGAIATTGIDVGMDLTTIDRVKRQLRNVASVEDDEQLAELITSVSRRMETYMGREAYREERTEYFAAREGQSVYRLKALPLLEVAAVYYDQDGDFPEDSILTEGSDYAISEECGQILLRFSPTFAAPRALKVVYTGGLAEDVQELVDEGYADLVQAATTQVVNDFRRLNSAADLAESSTTPGGSRSYARDGWVRAVQDVLDRYRIIDL